MEPHSIVLSCSSTDLLASFNPLSNFTRISPMIFSTELQTLSNTLLCCAFWAGVLAGRPGMSCADFEELRKEPFL